MSRSIDREENRQQASASLDGLSRSGGETRPRAVEGFDSPRDFGENKRERIVIREREYKVRQSEYETLEDLGKFRLIREEDLIPGVYGTREELGRADLRSLRQQGLVRMHRFCDSEGGQQRIHTLTAAGYDLVRSRSEKPHFYYWGIVKPSEVEHDSLLYRAYLRERELITQLGGKVTRVVLDFELKGKHFAKVNKPGVDYRSAQAESATELRLPVVDGHTMFPDLRIEYEDDRGEPSRADIEVATGNYREKHIAAKVAAGFRVYAARGVSGGGPYVQSGGRLRGQIFPQETRVVLSL